MADDMRLTKAIEVYDSCGCVFCDLDLKPEKHPESGALVHSTGREDIPYLPCRLDALKEEGEAR